MTYGKSLTDTFKSVSCATIAVNRVPFSMVTFLPFMKKPPLILRLEQKDANGFKKLQTVYNKCRKMSTPACLFLRFFQNSAPQPAVCEKNI